MGRSFGQRVSWVVHGIYDNKFFMQKENLYDLGSKSERLPPCTSRSQVLVDVPGS